jgi:hypothetical protein
MKIFVEVLKKVVMNNHIDYVVKTQIEKTTLAKAKTALNDLVISTDEKKRIHKCYHDEHPPKKCEIV